MTARSESVKPNTTIENAWSTVARFSETWVNGLVSHSMTVSMGRSSLNGVISWQLSGRNWWKSGGMVQDPSMGIWYWFSPIELNGGVGRQERLEAGLLVLGRGVGDDTRGAAQGLVQGEQDGQLEQERQAAAEHADPVLAVQGGLLLAHLGGVALVLALDLA